MKTGLFILITFHGLFHLAGFSRAFDLEAESAYSKHFENQWNSLAFFGSHVCSYRITIFS